MADKTVSLPKAQAQDTAPDPKQARRIAAKLAQPIVEVCKGLYIGTGIHAELRSPTFRNIRAGLVINCAKEYEYIPRETSPDEAVQPEPTYMRVSIRRDDSISFLENIDSVMEQIDQAREQNINVYLHGDKSKSRAPAIAIYYLMMRRNYSYFDARGQLEDSMPISLDQCFEDILLIIQD